VDKAKVVLLCYERHRSKHANYKYLSLRQV